MINRTQEIQNVADKAMSMIGLSHLAYVRKIEGAKGTDYALFAADGTQLAVFPTRDAAYFTARQHDLEVQDVN